MTPIDLLNSLGRFTQDATKEMALPYRVERDSGDRPERPPEIFIQDLPSKEAMTQQVPYILLQYLTGEDNVEEEESTAHVRIIFVLYARNANEGSLDVLATLTTLKIAILKTRVLDGRYLLADKVESIVYPDQEPPYFFGEIMTTWQMPVVEREVDLHGYEV